MRGFAGTARLLPALCLVVSLCGTGAARTAAAATAKPFDKGLAAYKARNYAAAHRVWSGLAIKGHALAQYNLGIMYVEGMGIARDYDLAMKWFGSAAESGFAPALVNLAVMHENGQGVRADREAALAYLVVASTALPPGKCRESAVRRRQAISASLPAKAILHATRRANRGLRPAASMHSYYSFDGDCFGSIALGGGTIRAIAQISGFRPPASQALETKTPDRSVASDVATRGPAAARPAPRPAARRAGRHAVAKRDAVASRAAGRWTYYGQLASLPTIEAAQRLRATLQKRHAGTLGGREMSIQEARLEKLGTVFRVRVGPFGEKAAARDLCRTLKEERQACFVVRRAKAAG